MASEVPKRTTVAKRRKSAAIITRSTTSLRVNASRPELTGTRAAHAAVSLANASQKTTKEVTRVVTLIVAEIARPSTSAMSRATQRPEAAPTGLTISVGYGSLCPSYGNFAFVRPSQSI